MLRLALIILILVGLTGKVCAQWMDLSSDRKDVKFDGNIGFMAAAGGTLLVSVDAGKNWKNLASPLPSNYSIEHVEVFDGGQSVKILGNRYIQDGMVSYGSLLYSSHDGGITWHQDYSFVGDNLNCYFLNDSIGWLMVNGRSGNAAKKTWKTIDGGHTWIEETTLKDAYKIFFHNLLQGWAVVFNTIDSYTSPTYIYKTNDGGVTWAQSHRLDLALPKIYYGWSFELNDENEAWIGGYNSNPYTSKLYHTTNGGETWTEKKWYPDGTSEPSGYNITDITFINNQTGFVISSEKQKLYRTNDHGQTWQLVLTSSDYYEQKFEKVVFLNSLDGIIIGSRGYHASTNDGGVTWQLENHCAAGNNYGVTDLKIEDNAQWVVCGDLILKSNDKSWENKTPATSSSYQFSGIDFINNTTGLLVGKGYGSTQNGGDTWEQKYPNFGYPSGFSYQNMKVYYRSPSSIWLTGVNGYIFKSTDGGATFSTRKQGPASQFTLTFQSDNIVWAYDNTGFSNGFISTNAGGSWTTSNQKITSVYFLNESIGWKLLYNKALYKTIDGGMTWTFCKTLSFMPAPNSPSLEFADERNGWLLTFPGKIYYTNDGGLTWSDNKSDVAYRVGSLKIGRDANNNVIGLAGGSKLLKYVGTCTLEPVVTLNQPSDLILSNINNTQIGLTWSDNSDNEDGFIIQYQNSSGVFQTIDTVAANITSVAYPINILTQKNYTYRIAAFIKHRIIVFSQPTTTSLPLPSPQNLFIVEPTESSMIILWDDYNLGVDNIAIERSLDNLSFSLIGMVTNTTVSYQDTNLEQNTKYYYRLKAISVANESAYESISGLTIPQAAPNAPTNLFVTAHIEDITLTWDDNATNEVGFIIERSKKGESFVVLDSVTANTTEYIDLDIEQNVMYSYRVRAYREYSVSGYVQSSAILSITEIEEDIANKFFSLFPNPTADKINISLNQGNVSEIRVLDSKGSTVRSCGATLKGGIIQLDLSNLPAGIYFVQLYTNQFTVTKKIIRK